eukprot:1658-Heterococcus_DN1.PRE.1
MPSTEQIDSTNNTGISAFYIHSMKFLSAVVNCNSYRFDTLEAAIAKGSITCSSSSSGDVPVTDEIATQRVQHGSVSYNTEVKPRELHDWSDDSEQFYIEQESVTADETLRVESIALYMALLESYDHKATVATSITEMLLSTEQQQQSAITSQQLNETVLLVDACYLAVGLASHVLESDSVQVKVTLSEWISRFLLNAVSSLVQHSLQQPPVLLRRILWCVGCCAPYLEPDATTQSTALAVAILNTTASAQCMDATVQLACVTAIHAILEAWNLDIDSAIVPIEYKNLSQDNKYYLHLLLFWSAVAHQCSTYPDNVLFTINSYAYASLRMQQRASEHLPPFANDIIQLLPRVWDLTQQQTPLRPMCLTVMNHVVNSVGSASVAIAPTVLQMVAVATAATTTITSSGDSMHSTTNAYLEESYLANEGVELWCTMARHSPVYTTELHSLFPQLVTLLAASLDHVMCVMEIADVYVVLGQVNFLSAYVQQLSTCLTSVAAQIEPLATICVTHVMHSILLTAPVQGPAILSGAVEYLIYSICSAREKESSCEPDTVIVQHLTVIARLLTTHEGVAVITAVVQECSTTIGDLVADLIRMFHAVGGGSVHRQRLYLWAIVLTLPKLSSQQVHALLDDVVAHSVEVLSAQRQNVSPTTTTTRSSRATGQHSLYTDDSSIAIDAIPDGVYKQLLIQQRAHDPVHHVELTSAIRHCMQQCATPEAIETVEPAVHLQLQTLLSQT